MKLPTPTKLGLPEPPPPPNSMRMVGFFGLADFETEKSKIRRAEHRGAREMWDRFMGALYPEAP